MKIIGNESAVSRHNTWLIPSIINEKLLPSAGNHSALKCKLAGLLNASIPTSEVARTTRETNRLHVLPIRASLIKKPAIPQTTGININKRGIIYFFKVPTSRRGRNFYLFLHKELNKE